ncbi:MAG TPA: squalene/phytoene synthase family protein [Solirubrobacteraceae bacterium]|nr:squalene/phytoene synthase family protein [Solirubrobacteraceae bacterium]
MSPDAERTRLAYRQCESLTRAAAGNFYYGICLLPAPKRRAMCAVYAFARRVDDIGDGELPPAEKLRRLDALGRGVAALSLSDPDPVMAALADARERFALPADALEDLIAGVEMDVRGTTYANFAELELYCRRVAGSIGRLCLAIFGRRGAAASSQEGPPRSAEQLADDLGVAMQITNIARDLREDAERGRVYLPAKDLVRYHLHDDAPLDASALRALVREGSKQPPEVVAGFGGGDVGQLYALLRFQCLRARDWFHRGLPLLGLLDRRSAACVLAMAGIYLRLLRRIEEHPDEALARRISLPMREKAWVAARALLGKGVPERHPAERLQPET